MDAGQLAASHGSDAMVRMFGQMMVSDHTTALNELQSLASRKGASVPGAPDAEHMAIKAQLAAMSGRAFDSAYMHTQLNDHNMAITLFESEMNGGYNQDVKSYANKYLPALRMHKQKVDSIIMMMNF